MNSKWNTVKQHNHCDFTNLRLFLISLTYPGSEIVCQVSSSEISTGLGRQFVAMLHFIQLNIFGDELGVLSRVSRLTNHRHDHFVRQLKRFVIICNTRNISIWLPFLKGFERVSYRLSWPWCSEHWSCQWPPWQNPWSTMLMNTPFYLTLIWRKFCAEK